MKGVIVFGALAIGITFVGAEAAERSLIGDAVTTAMSACADCYICDPERPEEYVPAVSTNPEYDFGIFANYCNENPLTGDCENLDPCPTQALVDATESLTRAGDAEKLGWLVRTRPQQVAFLAERSAIQVMGCSGKVVAQYSVTATIAAALTAPVVATD